MGDVDCVVAYGEGVSVLQQKLTRRDMENRDEPALLEYRRPLSARGVRVRTADDEVHIDAGPMSNMAFMSTIVVESLGAIVSFVVVVMFLFILLRVEGLALLTIAILAMGFYGSRIALVAMRRHEHQKCGVMNNVIHFSSASMHGVLDDKVTWRIVARRHLLMPWLWCVVAKPPFLTFRLSSANNPVKTTLLIGLDGETSREVARTLNGALAVSRSSRPGGFEVIIKE